jgi:hypothetical protein
LLLRHYAISQKIAGSRPDEVNKFFSIYLILPATLGPLEFIQLLTEMSTRKGRKKAEKNFWGTEPSR